MIFLYIFDLGPKVIIRDNILISYLISENIESLLMTFGIRSNASIKNHEASYFPLSYQVICQQHIQLKLFFWANLRSQVAIHASRKTCSPSQKCIYILFCFVTPFSQFYEEPCCSVNTVCYLQQLALVKNDIYTQPDGKCIVICKLVKSNILLNVYLLHYLLFFESSTKSIKQSISRFYLIIKLFSGWPFLTPTRFFLVVWGLLFGSSTTTCCVKMNYFLPFFILTCPSLHIQQPIPLNQR